MSEHKFSDLHCHPAWRPRMLSYKTLWDTHLGKKHKKIKKDQKKGLRGKFYDQSGYPKLVNGQVKLVFASMYPLEQGFMMNTNPVLAAINFVFRGGPLMWLKFNPFGSHGHVRDFILSLYAKFPLKRIRELKKNEYWHSLEEEFSDYLKENKKHTDISKNNIKEIDAILKHIYRGHPTARQNVVKSGKYIIADQLWNKQIPQGDDILTVLTMEGMAIVSQKKQGAKKSRHGTVLDDDEKIRERLGLIKDTMPIFFITFSHHFSTELCGHARSFPTMTRDLGFLNQEYFINENYSRLGYGIMQDLLCVKMVDGQWLKDESKGRRIFIDVKHMSLRGRLALYQLVNGYNNNPQNTDRIPIIASHVGYSNKTIADMLYATRPGGETKKSQKYEEKIYGRDHIFNTWSINLGVEEIGIIVDTGGLIGLSMEQNNLGIPFGKKTKKEKHPFFVRLVLNQLMAMARAAGKKEFWDCITMGTDFDGMIDPVDQYSSSLFFSKLRSDLSVELANISQDEQNKAGLSHVDLRSPQDMDALLDKIFFQNSFDFLTKHFDNAKMPIL